MSKNVLVTGSSNGIGAASAIAFAKLGYNVGITYCKNPEGAEKVQAECLKYGIDAKIYKADFQFREDCEKLMQEFLADFGTIDVLVNNAGGALQIPAGEFEDLPLDYWDRQITLNLSSAAYCAQAAIRNMKKNNIPGRIVNISSVHGTISWVKRKFLPYCAAKGGLEMMTKALAVEVAKYGIRVNCIAPGAIRTPMLDCFTEEDLAALAEETPVGRIGTPEDVAKCEASYTGHFLKGLLAPEP